ncbi:MAG: dienelactone hydrolase, partial [Brevundimonas sp.]|nr:dienelactone hydrolase [Brevundimonas sp.]
GIMEAMSSPRGRSMLGVVDPGAVSLNGVVGAWLAYPYVGVGAVNRMRPWTHCPKTLAVISRTDHLTTVRNAERVHDMVRRCGGEVETWIADGSHAFDEPMAAAPMRHHPELAAEAEQRFVALLNDVAVAPAV